MSTYFQSPTRRAALILLGGLGTILCLAGIVGVWMLESRLNRVRQQLASAAADTLEYLDHQSTAARVVVSEAKLTVGEVEERLSKWTREEIVDRAGEQLELEGRLERLTGAVEGAQRTAVNIEQGLDSVKRVFVVAGELGLPFTGETADSLASRLAAVRSEIDAVAGTMTELRHQLAVDDESNEQGGIAQAVKLAGRFVATFGRVDKGLDEFAADLATLQGQLTQVASRTRWKILAAATLATLLLLWMAAGQISLLRRGKGK